MRKPRTTSEVFHKWAHQVRDEVRVGNVGYRGATLFSYAEPIAHIVDSNTVLHSLTRFSKTTNTHQSKARAASRHMSAIYAPVLPTWGHTGDYGYVHLANDRAWRREIESALNELENHPRRKISVAAKINTVLDLRKTYVEFFKLDWNNDLDALREQFAEETRQAEIRAEEVRKARAEEIARAVDEEKADLIRWRNGEHVRRSFHAMALRVVGDEVETTRGARVPVDEVPQLWRILSAWKTKGLSVNRDDLSVKLMFGNFQFTSFDTNGTLTVGCHTIPWGEIENVANQLELQQEAA